VVESPTGPRPAAPLETQAFRDGLFAVQDAGQTEVVDCLDLARGQRVLDFCAAPGGKTTAIAGACADQAAVFAFDRDQGRLSPLPSELARLGINCVQILPRLEAVAQAAPFDRILVDAPCSNTGVLARRAEARWRLSESLLVDLDRQQAALLLQARDWLAPGGRLVYATCSIEPEENEVLARRLADQLGLRLLSAERVLPEQGVCDGAGIAVFLEDPRR
jgi:16S rRNA (cytosine967-C5)-methyltransferase